MLAGRKPKDDERKVNRVPLTHDWIDVPDVAYVPSAEEAVLPGRPAKPVRDWWAIVSTMPHCAIWEAGQWQFARDTARVYAAFMRKDGERYAAELRDRYRRLGMTMEGMRDLRIRYVKPTAPTETGGNERVTDFDAERRRRLLEGE